MPPPKPPRARAPAPARRTKSPPYTVGFYLVPEFPMMAFASAIEPLRAANRMSGERLFAWQLYSRNGDPVRASGGSAATTRDAPISVGSASRRLRRARLRASRLSG